MLFLVSRMDINGAVGDAVALLTTEPGLSQAPPLESLALTIVEIIGRTVEGRRCTMCFWTNL